MISVGIIIASDKGYSGEREDKSNALMHDILSKKDFQIEKSIILPDDIDMLEKELTHMCDNLKLNLILTTGGTGFSKRDVTPGATKRVVLIETPGIAEAIRSYSLQITPRAMLSRGVSGIRNDTLIVNLPGSPKAVKEILDYCLDTLIHGIEIMLGDASECARK